MSHGIRWSTENWSIVDRTPAWTSADSTASPAVSPPSSARRWGGGPAAVMRSRSPTGRRVSSCLARPTPERYGRDMTETAQHAIDTMLLEERRYSPSPEFAAQANAKSEIYDRDPLDF